jgi:hypothetical protein
MKPQKVPLSQRWKYRHPSKPKTITPMSAPAPVATRTALTPVERILVDRWVAARIVNYPPDRCFGCRRPIISGAKWVTIVGGDNRARFHADCAPVWRAQQEVAARRALGLARSERA